MTQNHLKEQVLYNIINILSKTLLLLAVLCLIFIIGLFIGYSIIGNGSFWEVLNVNTWKHITDFIK